MFPFHVEKTFFPHEMDKLTVVLMSKKRLNKERRPLTGTFTFTNLGLTLCWYCIAVKLKNASLALSLAVYHKSSDGEETFHLTANFKQEAI